MVAEYQFTDDLDKFGDDQKFDAYWKQFLKELVEADSINVLELKDHVGSLKRKLDSIENYLSSTVSNKKHQLDNVYFDIVKYMDNLENKQNKILEINDTIDEEHMGPLYTKMSCLYLTERKNKLDEIRNYLITFKQLLASMKKLQSSIGTSEVMQLKNSLSFLKECLKQHSNLSFTKIISSKLKEFEQSIRDMLLKDMCSIQLPDVSKKELLDLIIAYEELGLIENFAFDLITKVNDSYEEEIVLLLNNFTVNQGIDIGFKISYESSNLIFECIPSHKTHQFFKKFENIVTRVIGKCENIKELALELLQKDFIHVISSNQFDHEFKNFFNKLIGKGLTFDMQNMFATFSFEQLSFIDYHVVLKSMKNIRDIFIQFNLSTNYSNKLEKYLSSFSERYFNILLEQFDAHEFDNWDKISSFSTKVRPDVFFCNVVHIESINVFLEKFINHTRVNLFTYNLLNLIVNLRILIDYNSNLINLFYPSVRKCLDYLFNKMNLLFDNKFEAISMNAINNNLTTFNSDQYAEFMDRYHMQNTKNTITMDLNKDNYKHKANSIISICDNVKLLLKNLNLLFTTLDSYRNENASSHDACLEIISDKYGDILNYILFCKYINILFDKLDINSEILSYTWNQDSLPMSHLPYIDKIFILVDEFKKLFSSQTLKSLEYQDQLYNLFFLCFTNQCSFNLVTSYAYAPIFSNSEGCAQRLLDNMQLFKSLVDLFTNDTEEAELFQFIEASHMYCDGFIKIFYLPQNELESSIIALNSKYLSIHLEKLIMSLPQISKRQKQKIIEKLK